MFQETVFPAPHISNHDVPKLIEHNCHQVWNVDSSDVGPQGLSVRRCTSFLYGKSPWKILHNSWFRLLLPIPGQMHSTSTSKRMLSVLIFLMIWTSTPKAPGPCSPPRFLLWRQLKTSPTVSRSTMTVAVWRTHLHNKSNLSIFFRVYMSTHDLFTTSPQVKYWTGKPETSYNSADYKFICCSCNSYSYWNCCYR